MRGFAVDFGNESLVFIHQDVALDFECGREETVGGGPLVDNQTEVLDLLVGGEVAVDDVDDLFVFLFGLGHGKKLAVVAVVEMVLECPVVEGVEVGRDDDGDALLVFAY